MTASHFRCALSPESTLSIKEVLQPLVFDLSDLAMQIKHLHWNVRGALFQPLHEQLDSVHETVLDAVDSLAERQIMLGHPVDGLSQSVAKSTRMNAIPVHFFPTQEVIDDLSNRLLRVIEFLREGIDKAGSLDPVTQDLLIGVTADLEKHLWMLQAQQL
jgi:starvation-inducible DNA-binding protein